MKPSPAQIEAGNYAKKHLRICGLDLSIENRKGSVRSGKGKDGKEWRIKMPVDYGYIKGTLGPDGDHVDVFVGPDRDLTNESPVWVVNQKKDDGKTFDEHKVLLGFPDIGSAVAAYRNSYDIPMFGNLVKMSLRMLKLQLRNGRLWRPLKEFAGLLPKGYSLPEVIHEKPAGPTIGLYEYPKKTPRSPEYSYSTGSQGNNDLSKGKSNRAAPRKREAGVITIPREGYFAGQLQTGDVPDGELRVLAHNARRGVLKHEIVHSILDQKRGGVPDSVAGFAKEELAAHSKQFLGKKSPLLDRPLSKRLASVIRGTIASTKLGVKANGIKKWFADPLTRDRVGMALKTFSDRTPYCDPRQFPGESAAPVSSERRDLLKSGIIATGVAGGAGLAGLAMRGSVNKAQKADLLRDAVNKIVAARKGAKTAAQAGAVASAKGAQDASIEAQKLRVSRIQGVKKTDARLGKVGKSLVKNGALTPGEAATAKTGFRSSHARLTGFSARLHLFDAAVIREKRDGLSKAKDAAVLAGGLGVLGASAYAGIKAHGISKLVKGEIPKVSRAIRRAVPPVAKKANDLLDAGKAAAGQLQTTAKEANESVGHSTAVYSDIGKLYKQAKGGVYNLLHPVNTVREVKSAFRAGLRGEETYPTKPRPKWALSAKIKTRLKEFADRLETSEEGVPLNGRVAHDRFIKQIHEGDLDRRDRNISHAGVAGALTGALVAKPGKRLIGAGAGAALGGAGVLAIRAITDRHRDIYGDRPRWAKDAETLPAVAGAGAALGIIGKRVLAGKRLSRVIRLKTFDLPDDDQPPMNPALKAGLTGAVAGGVMGSLPAFKVGSKLAPSLGWIGAGAAGMGALVGGGTYIGDKILGPAKPNEGAPFTKRAAIGGALLGTAAGAGAVLAAKKIPAVSKFIDGYADFRPVNFIKNASLPAATAAGAGVGALVGADKAGDEGQQVDALNSIQNQKKTFGRQVRGLLKEFGYSDQSRRQDGKFRNPVAGAFGVDDDNGDVSVRQVAGAFYRKGQTIHRWTGRGTGVVSDAGSVLSGQPRDRDASGRPRKREWEKAWFKNALGSAAAGGALLAGAHVTKNTAWGRRVVQPKLRAASNWAAGKGVNLLSAKMKPESLHLLTRLHLLDEWAEYHGWDVRDPRGRSARVFAPGSRPRTRREKEWHEKKDNREALLKGAVVGAAALGVAGGYAGTRLAGGKSLIPSAVKGLLKSKPLSVAEAEAHLAAAKSREQKVVNGPWRGTKPLTPEQ